MKRLLSIAAVLLLSSPALADPASAPPKPTYDELQQQADYWHGAYLVTAQQLSKAEETISGFQADKTGNDYAAQAKADREKKSK